MVHVGEVEINSIREVSVDQLGHVVRLLESAQATLTFLGLNGLFQTCKVRLIGMHELRSKKTAQPAANAEQVVVKKMWTAPLSMRYVLCCFCYCFLFFILVLVNNNSNTSRRDGL